MNARNIAMTGVKIEIDRGSGNVFADLGVADANAMALKSGLAIRLGELIKHRGLSQSAAAALTGISQPDLSRLLRGLLQDFSSDRLVRALNLLAADVEITVYSDGDKVGETIHMASAA